MIHRFALTLLATMLSATTAWTQTPAAVRLTVDDAVARAFQASHRLAEGRARQEAAEATVRIRHTASQPVATGTAGYTRTNHVDPFGFPQPDGRFLVVYPDVPDNFLTRVGALWPIYTAGRAGALEAAAAAEAGAVARDVETTRADLRLEVRRSYWALATSRETVRVLEESVMRAEAQVRDARERLNAGLVPPSDVLSFEAQLSREELQLIEAVNLRESSLIELRRLTGLPADTPIELADPLDRAPAFPSIAQPSVTRSGTVPPESDAISAKLVGEALGQRPERQALVLRIDSTEARARAAGAGNKPSVAIAGGVDFAKPNSKIFPREDIWQPSWDVGANLTWTFFDSGRTRAEVVEATATARATEERLKDLDTIVEADVRQRVLDLRSGLAAVRSAETGVRSATEARRVLGERFAVGVATTTDVLIAQDQLLGAELSRARALANVRLAEARLERALGRP